MKTRNQLLVAASFTATFLAPQAVSAISLDYDPTATGPAINSISVSSKTLSTQDQIDLTDDSESTGPNLGRFIEFDIITALNAPVSGEAFRLTSFELVLSTECDSHPGASFTFTDLSGVEQPLGLTFTHGSNLTRLTADIGSEGIFVGPNGLLSVLGASYVACEPETSLVEVVVETELVSAVPEAGSTVALLMTSLAGMGMVRRRVC